MAKTAMYVTMVGRFTADPQVKQMQGNKGPYNIGNFSVAVERPFGARKDENGNPVTDFWNCEAIGSSASFLQYCKKGNLVLLNGYFYMDSYVDKNGVNQRVPRFHADNIINLESRQDGQQGGNNGGGYNQNGSGYQNQGGQQNYQRGGQQNGGGYQNQGNQNGGQNNYQQNNQGGYQNQNGQGQQQGGYQNSGQNNYQQNNQGGGYQNQNGQGQQQGGYQQNGGGYNQNGGGYQQNNGGYQNQGQNNQNGGGQPMNPPEGFAPADDDPFGLFGGAPDNY